MDIKYVFKLKWFQFRELVEVKKHYYSLGDETRVDAMLKFEET